SSRSSPTGITAPSSTPRWPRAWTGKCERRSSSGSRPVARASRRRSRGADPRRDAPSDRPPSPGGEPPMPVLEREEYIEQAYFFRTFRERLLDGLPAQDILARIGEELLSTTRLPLAVAFLCTEIKVSGLMAPAMTRIGHYFTPFQTHVIDQAEHDVSRFAMEQALLVLGREAKSKAETPPLPPLFVSQSEALSRNRLGYTKGLAAMADDPFYTEDWADYILTLRSRLGDVDFADLIFVRSEY